MSVAVALATQCAYCIEAHIENAVRAGASREEIAETVFIAAALRARGRLGMALWQCVFSTKQATQINEDRRPVVPAMDPTGITTLRQRLHRS